MLYLLGLGSPTHPLPAASWRAWVRPTLTWDGSTYVTHAGPLFLHQYSHAWVDFRAWRDPDPPHDWFANSVAATRANRGYCLSIRDRFPGYAENLWGVTASDARDGYKAWGGPPPDPQVDGTVVPCAAAGSLMFAPDLTLPALQAHEGALRRSPVRALRLRRRLPPDRELDQPGRDRHRPRHHAALGREPAQRQRVALVHGQPGDQDGDAARRLHAGGRQRQSARPRTDRAIYELVAAPDRRPTARGPRGALDALPASLADRFEAKTFTAPDGVTLPYRLLPPPTPPPPGTRVPLVLVLHGSGEIGTDNRAQLTPLALAWARDEARARDRRLRASCRRCPRDPPTYSGPADRRRAHVAKARALVPATLALARLARRRRCRSIGSGSASSASRWARRRRGTCCTRGRASSPPRSRSPACRAPTRRRRRSARDADLGDPRQPRRDQSDPPRSARLRAARRRGRDDPLLGDRSPRPRGAADLAHRRKLEALPTARTVAGDRARPGTTGTARRENEASEFAWM